MAVAVETVGVVAEHQTGPVAQASRATQRPDKISLIGAGKTFIAHNREIRALQPTDLNVMLEESVALVGPSGCGKSTILNLIAGLIEPAEGQVIYDGAPVADVNRRVGYMT